MTKAQLEELYARDERAAKKLLIVVMLFTVALSCSIAAVGIVTSLTGAPFRSISLMPVIVVALISASMTYGRLRKRRRRG